MPKTPTPPAVRFMRHVNVSSDPNGCWLWTGAVFHGVGYGMFRVDGNPNGGCRVVAHRFAYELFVGPVPDGLILRHTCDVRTCVRPDHLVPGTYADNARDTVERGRWRGGRKYDPTQCPQGHPRTTENTLIYERKNGTKIRICRDCRRQRCGTHHAPQLGSKRRPGRPSKAA